MPVPTTRDFAVKFGRTPELGLEGQKAFPFVYSFVNRNDDPWSPVAVGTQPSLANIGPTVPAGGVVQKNVLLDPDYNFKLLAVRYTAYKWVPPNGVSGYYSWYEALTGTSSDGMDPDMDYIGTAMHHYVGITLSVQGSGSNILHGGPNCNAIGNGLRVPLQVDSVQGYEYGYLTCRVPYLLPRQGIMVFEITNTSPNDLVVGAAIYGMKIRV